MIDEPYPIFGSGIPKMYDRHRSLDSLVRSLTKPQPDHVSVIGPRYIGKSVLLMHLVEHFSDDTSAYNAALYWDLGHETPESDFLFKLNLVQRLKTALRAANLDEAGDLEELDGSSEQSSIQYTLDFVFDSLVESDKKVLVVLDGFDRLLASTRITSNLWDYLRTLAERRSLRLVTGSRQPLRELCRSEESRTSDFWRIFNTNPLRIGKVELDELDAFLCPFEDRRISFEKSARTELMNWTGGVPILLAAFLSVLFENTSDGSNVQGSDVNTFAPHVREQCGEVLAALWDDCDSEMQLDLVDLAIGTSKLSVTEIPAARKRKLEDRGYINVSGERLHISCRLIKEFAKQQAQGIGDISRLFGDDQRFAENIHRLLELRLSQHSGIDSELKRRVEQAIHALGSNPEDAISWARDIFDRAMKLIWDAELGVGNDQFPERWISARSRNDKERPVISFSCVPERRGEQAHVVRNITGTNHTNHPLAQYVSKSTAILLDQLLAVGDYYNHRPLSALMPPYLIYSACFAMVELCGSLTADLLKTE